MKEITRIHLAKIAYDIELDAKKELATYERELRNHLEDLDTLDDIEVRMSELLAEHGVKPGDVITFADVESIREQLGEPSEFGDKNYAAESGDEKPVRKLYRDLDNAMLGGVMSGIAAYFRLDPTFVRILGLVLIVVSFGMILLIYVLLWLLIPAAKTASQRLELMGKPLTVENINATGESTLSSTAEKMRHVLLMIAGLSAVAIAVLSLAAARIILWNPSNTISPVDLLNNPSLFIATAGVVFAMFMSVIAYGLIRRTWRRQLTFALLCMTIIGIATFGMGVYGFYVQPYDSRQGSNAYTLKVEHFPTPNMVGVKRLLVDSNVPVFYNIDEPSLSVRATEIFQPTLTVSGDTATLHYSHGGDAAIILSGPALASVEVVQNSFGYVANGGALSVTLDQFATATLKGSLSSLDLNVKGNGAAFDGQQLVVDAVKIVKSSNNAGESAKARVTLATVGSLDISYPIACATLAGLEVSTENVAGSLTANGQAVQLPFETGCFGLSRTQ